MVRGTRRIHDRIHRRIHRNRRSKQMACMRWYDLLSVLIGVSGFVWGVRSYWKLREWGLLVKYGRIVIASKGKVRVNATIQEWALWCRASEKDPDHQTTHGRVVYDLRGTRVAVLHKSFVPDSYFKQAYTFITNAIAKHGTRTKSEAPRAREGTWSAEDHTVVDKET